MQATVLEGPEKSPHVVLVVELDQGKRHFGPRRAAGAPGLAEAVELIHVTNPRISPRLCNSSGGGSEHPRRVVRGNVPLELVAFANRTVTGRRWLSIDLAALPPAQPTGSRPACHSCRRENSDDSHPRRHATTTKNMPIQYKPIASLNQSSESGGNRQQPASTTNVRAVTTPMLHQSKEKRVIPLK